MHVTSTSSDFQLKSQVLTLWMVAVSATSRQCMEESRNVLSDHIVLGIAAYGTI